MKLTEKVVAGLTLPDGVNERLFSDDEVTGLSVRLRRGANGVTRSWAYRYMVAGVARKVTFDFAGHSLADIRKRAGDLQARVRLGADPAQERAQTQADVQRTMAATLPTYLPEKRAHLRPRSYVEVERHLLHYCKPLHRIPLRLVTTRDVTDRHLAIAAESGRTTATNTLRSLSAFFTWAELQGLIDKNPCRGVECFPDRKRDRVLSAVEIKAVWDATAGSDDYSAVVRLLLLSGARANEIARLRWDEVFADRIVLPPERVKNGKRRVIPLTPAMRAVLDGRPRRSGREHVFGPPGRGFSGWSESKRALDCRIREAGIVMEPWVNHDLRRTLSTGLNELGVLPHVVEVLLGHAGFRDRTAAHYNFAQYEGAVRHALGVWDQHIGAIAEGRTTGDRVVPLPLRA